MARTLRDRAADQLRQRGEQIQAGAASAVDRAIDTVTSLPNHIRDIPKNIKHTAEGVKDSTLQRADLLLTTAQAKQMLKDRLYDTENHNEQDFVYALATDDQLRKTVRQLVEPVLNPTPVTADPMFKENSYINIGAGLSTFWHEIQQKTPIEIDEMVELDNILMSIEAGLDKDMEPETRKSMLKIAGLSKEQIDELVPQSDYVEYDDRVKEGIRAQVIADFGLDSENLSEQDELMVDAIVEDRIMATKLQVDPEEVNQGPTYEDTYGYSAQDLYEMFSDEPVPDDMPQDMPVDDGYWAQYMEGPLEELQDIYDAPPEENWAAYQQIMEEYQDTQQEFPTLTDADLAFAEEMNQQEISEEDLAFAESWAREEGLGEFH